MPILTIQIPTGYAAPQKEALLHGLTRAVTTSIGAPLASVRVTVSEVAPALTIVAGEIGKPAALIHCALIEGRTEQLKAALIAALSQAVQEALGLSTEHTRILLQDYPTTDMGVAGGISAKASGR